MKAHLTESLPLRAGKAASRREFACGKVHCGLPKARRKRCLLISYLCKNSIFKKIKTPSSKTGKFLEVSETFFKKDLTKNYGM